MPPVMLRVLRSLPTASALADGAARLDRRVGVRSAGGVGGGT
jgi:hypothetical protein